MISFVIPVRNAADHLPRCLASIAAAIAAAAEAEIVVVDNGSSDNSAGIARHLGARVVERPGLTVGACRNAGAADSRGDVLAFVDADNEIAAGWLHACLGAFQEQGVGAAGFPYEAPADPTWVQRMYDALRDKPAHRGDVDWLAAGNLAVRRAVFERIGGFDERLEACEDVQLCQSVRSAGYRVVSEPGMESVHHGDPQTLAHLFFGELWRGRDNLRVSLRGPWTLRTLPSALLPVAGLACVALVAVGLVAWPWVGAAAATLGLVGLLAIATAKALVVIVRGRLTRPLQWAQGFVVAATYETARALSLVSTATHRTRVRVARHA
jgi:cellulose synthase/poly-beta-1,6-N-acetylglucosamine synthase-like glycosyltransferase